MCLFMWNWMNLISTFSKKLAFYEKNTWITTQRKKNRLFFFVLGYFKREVFYFFSLALFFTLYSHQAFTNQILCCVLNLADSSPECISYYNLKWGWNKLCWTHVFHESGKMKYCCKGANCCSITKAPIVVILWGVGMYWYIGEDCSWMGNWLQQDI